MVQYAWCSFHMCLKNSLPGSNIKYRVTGIVLAISRDSLLRIRRRGRQKKIWEDNITEWTRIDFARTTMAAKDRTKWKGIVAKFSVVPQRPCKVVG